MTMIQNPSADDRWKAWDSFVSSVPASGFMQTSWWADFRLSAGYEHFAVVIRNGPEIVGGAVVMKYAYADDGCFFYIPEGPVLPEEDDAAREVFLRILRQIDERRKNAERPVSHLRIEPRWHQLPEFVQGFIVPTFIDPYREPRNTVCVDLTAPEETILARMKPKGRYNIRVAQRYGVTVVEDPSERGVNDFFRMYELTTARHGIETKPPEYFHELLAVLLQQRRGTIYFAEYLGQRIAGAVVIFFGDRATYMFGGSLVHYKSVMAPSLLHFEIIRRAKAMKFAWYDLWGTSPSGDSDDPWHAISVFKRKFGGNEVQLVPTLDLPYSVEAYRLFADLQSKNQASTELAHAE